MENKTLIEQTADFVKQELSGAEGGHDWWHVVRVWNNTRLLLQEENANRLICELGALLHDIADAKFHDGDDEKGLIVARQFLEKQHAVPEIIGAVIDIIQHVSFKGGIDENKPKTPELKVVQDADRLDAMGAIGIARTFNYGGFKNRKIYDPGIPPRTYKNKDDYYRSEAPTINHFYEKLLLLKDLM
ncbi:MAG TPA: HD domain-containing protein, partial [Bacteroidales bacterium]|nr:HD domain-containing protein [Bacteroidales bacterium]